MLPALDTLRIALLLSLPAAARSAPSAVKCKNSGQKHASFEDCEQFCDPEHASAHCAFCQCRTCGFCNAPAPSTTPQLLTDRVGAACDSHQNDDDSVAQCESWCGSDTKHCDFCKCRACSMCAKTALGTPPAPLPLIKPLPLVLPKCVEHNIEASCEGFCSPLKGEHCSSCRCTSCPFCIAYQRLQGAPKNVSLVSSCDWTSQMSHRTVEKREWCARTCAR